MKIAQIIQIGTPEPQYYNGVLMRANPTLHQEAFDVLRNLSAEGASVIDMGSGQGAFASRLRDNGYAVTCVDKNREDFKISDVNFIEVDFDSVEQVAAFKDANSGKYDVAIGMEVIEHVENPWEYCRFLLSLVKPDGLVFITTPNAESVSSRVNFLFSGLFDHFAISDYQGSGHINPLTVHELQLIANGVGAEIVTLRTLCKMPWLVVSRRVSIMLQSVLGALIRPWVGWRGNGDIACLVLKKK